MAKVIDEYYQATSQRLYNYPQYLVMLSNAIIYRNTVQAKVGEVNHPISQYSERTAASTDSLTGPENYTDAQDQNQRDLWKANKAINQLQNIVQPMGDALSVLSQDEARVISLRFWGLDNPKILKIFDSDGLQGKTWDEMEEFGYSRSTAQRTCNKARRQIRDAIFPCRQDEGTGIIVVE